MFSERGLRTSFLVFLASGILFYFIGWKDSAHDLIFVSVVMAGLGLALQPFKVPRRAWRLFHTPGGYQELQRFLAGNHECAYALTYAVHLPPADLLKFVRLIIESRYVYDQEILAELARIVNEEQKKDNGNVQ